MTLGLHWWSPLRSVRSAAAEAKHHARAWSYIASHARPRLTNFGDEVSRLVVEEITGQPVRWRPLRQADMVSVGSILNAVFKAQVTPMVLGSGVRNPEAPLAGVSDIRFLSVRGHLTRERLGLDNSTLLGDPGLIVRELLHGPAVARGTTGLVVPHFTVPQSRRGRELLNLARTSGWDIAFPNEHPLVMAEKIARSRVTVTSSLHAMVFAHSVGTPVGLATFDDLGPVEPTFKYDDYLSVFGLHSAVRPIVDLLALSASIVESHYSETAATVSANIDRVIADVYAAGASLR